MNTAIFKKNANEFQTREKNRRGAALGTETMQK